MHSLKKHAQTKHGVNEREFEEESRKLIEAAGGVKKGRPKTRPECSKRRSRSSKKL